MTKLGLVIVSVAAVACGKGDLSPQQVEQLLPKESPLPAQFTAPAAGLFLERVDY